MLLSLLLWTAQALADCSVQSTPPHQGRVCRQHGSITGNATAQFYAPSYDSCASRCWSSQLCISLTYEQKLGKCQFYTKHIIDMNFKRNASSTTIASSGLCDKNTIPCGLQNPSFETPEVRGGRVTPMPQGFGPDQRQIFLMPWYPSTYNNPASFAHVASSQNLPEGAQPVPDGNTFVNLTVIETSSIFLTQGVSLPPNTNYTLSCQYNYISSTISADNSTNTGTYIIILDSSTPQTSVNVARTDRANGDADGIWNVLSGTFVTPRPGVNLFMVFRVYAPRTGTGIGTSVFGFDDCVLSPTSVT